MKGSFLCAILLFVSLVGINSHRVSFSSLPSGYTGLYPYAFSPENGLFAYVTSTADHTQYVLEGSFLGKKTPSNLKVKLPPLRPVLLSSSANGKFFSLFSSGYITQVFPSGKGGWNATTVNVATNSLSSLLTTNAGETVAFSNNADGQWSSIFCVVGNKITHSGGEAMFAGAVAKLHPSQQYVYHISTELDPQSMYSWKFSATSCLEQMASNPDFGSWNFGSDFSFNDVGDRIFTNAANTFHCNPGAKGDMTFAGKLDTPMTTLPHQPDNAAYPVTFALADTNETLLQLVDFPYLNYVGNVTIASGFDKLQFPKNSWSSRTSNTSYVMGINTKTGTGTMATIELTE